MPDQRRSDEVPAGVAAVASEAKDIWNRLAGWWDEQVGDTGSSFSNRLLVPSTDRLLELQRGERILDVGCGNGWWSRKLARQGGHVVGFDFSEAFIERARARTVRGSEHIEFRVLDATDPLQLLGLGERGFDAAVCAMALMDMTIIDPLIESLSRLLRPNGRFVFSILHPIVALNEPYVVARGRTARQGASDPVEDSAGVTIRKGIGLAGQPFPHYYFHRRVSVILQACFRAGFVLDGMEEPIFADLPEDERPASWPRQEVPPFLVARVRLTGSRFSSEG